MDKNTLDQLWKLYREYCHQRIKTANGNIGTASDFLGWLEEHTR